MKLSKKTIKKLIANSNAIIWGGRNEYLGKKSK